MVFAFFFGMCSYIAVSKSVKTALGLGAAVTFVMVMTVPLNYLLNEYVLKANALVEGIDLSFLSFIVFIATIASFTQLVEMAVEKFSPTLYNQLGIFLPLIAVNCAIMGGSLFMQQKVDAGAIGNVWQSIVYGLGSGMGWWLAIVMMAAIREKDRLFAHPRRTQRARHRLYHHGSDGYRLHDFQRHQVVTVKD